MNKEERRRILGRLLIRKDHVMCTNCCKIETVHVGDGTPAVAFILALGLMARRHVRCRKPNEKA